MCECVCLCVLVCMYECDREIDYCKSAGVFFPFLCFCSFLAVSYLCYVLFLFPRRLSDKFIKCSQIEIYLFCFFICNRFDFLFRFLSLACCINAFFVLLFIFCLLIYRHQQNNCNQLFLFVCCCVQCFNLFAGRTISTTFLQFITKC